MAAAAAAAAAGQDMHLLHSISQSNLPMSEAGSERGNSPHDSEHSRYSGSRISQMNGTPNGMHSYPSPPAMQSGLPMLQQPYRPDSSFDNSIMQQETSRSRPIQGDVAPQKAFPCSSCGKGFARRSDLARHGKSSSIGDNAQC